MLYSAYIRTGIFHSGVNKRIADRADRVLEISDGKIISDKNN